MRSTLRRSVSLLVAFLLVVSLLMACSQNNAETSSETNTNTGTNAAQAEENSTDTIVEEEEESAKIDLKGRTIKLIHWWDGTPKGGSEMGDLKVKRREDVEKKFNMKFEWVNMPVDEIAPKFAASALAGSTIGEVVMMRAQMAIPTLAKKGYLLPLDDVIDFSQPQYDQSAKTYSVYDGKTYGFSTSANTSANLIFFNKDMFEKNGITNIYELVANKQWTWDKFEEIAKQLTKDTNGDGTTDIWGYSTKAGTSQFAWFYANGGEFAKIEDNKPVSTLTSENNIETLQFFNRITQVTKVAEWPAEDVAWDYSINQFKQGKAAMTLGGWWLAQDLKGNMTDKFGVLPLPIGPRGTDYVFAGDELQFYVIPANVEDPKGVLAAVDAFMQPLVPIEEMEEADLANAANNVWDAESVEVYKKVKSEFVYAQQHSLGDYWGTLHPAITSAINGEKSPLAAMEEVTPKWQNSMDTKE